MYIALSISRNTSAIRCRNLRSSSRLSDYGWIIGRAQVVYKSYVRRGYNIRKAKMSDSKHHYATFFFLPREKKNLHSRSIVNRRLWFPKDAAASAVDKIWRMLKSLGFNCAEPRVRSILPIISQRRRNDTWNPVIDWLWDLRRTSSERKRDFSRRWTSDITRAVKQTNARIACQKTRIYSKNIGNHIRDPSWRVE